MTSPSRALQGAGALLPALHTADPRSERSDVPGGVVDLAEVYRDSDEKPNLRNKGQNVDEGAPGLASIQAEVKSAHEDALLIVDTVEGKDDWETADARMEACLHGGISLTSLDVSSPLISPGFIKR